MRSKRTYMADRTVWSNGLGRSGSGALQSPVPAASADGMAP
ncbi:MAG: hypothetical protein PQJ59_03490 [Spirochaetales bacterium]|nr:hypothetical protein [Spirochaetales bacterium]